MPGGKDHRPDAQMRIDRRAWLASLLAGCALRSSRADDGETVVDGAEAQEIQDIQSLAKTVGLGPFRVRLTPHFLGIGNASVAYSTYILQTCEAFNARYLQHFRG